MKGLYLRKAEYSDMDLLYKWANDSVTRNNSFNSDFISYEEHVRWFNRMMEDDSVLQFIMMNSGTPVGQIRLNINADRAEIGYSIAEEQRGNGYGHKILRLIADTIFEEHPEIKVLSAKVKPDNAASNRLFQNEGYEMQYFYYTKEIQNTRRS